jgi:uncharacterized protein
MTPTEFPIRFFGRARFARHRPVVVLQPKSLELLVLQPSPFCNLDCSYCYLPDRSDKRRMSLETLDATLRKVAASPLLGPRLSIIWHAGEPTAVPSAWYEEAFGRIARVLDGVAVVHHFQTNAMLIDDAWCNFFRRHAVQVGVSVDGPAFLHDRHRRTRDGRPTHARVVEGMKRLRRAAISFHVIAVLTRESLVHADAIYEFMADCGASELGLNVEEIELGHTHSSLEGEAAAAELAAFWDRLLDCMAQAPTRLRVREVDTVLMALQSDRFGSLRGNQQNQFGHILNVAWDGDYGYWSPELMGAQHPRFGQLAVGNVHDNGASLGSEPRLAELQAEIDEGVARCRTECRHFDFCLGGAPANKLFEHGHFAGSDTMACRVGQRASVDAVLGWLDRILPPQQVAPAPGYVILSEPPTSQRT